MNVASIYSIDLFTASSQEDTSRIYAIVHHVSLTINDEFLLPFREEEVCVALKDMASLKALDIDGYSVLFFQKFWPIVGKDVIAFYFSVLNGEIGIEGVNQEHIVLILKVVYKIIAKIFVCKMMGVLESCIHKAQEAFIPGRQIFDNVLVAYEVLHPFMLKHNGATGTFALKLDMSKAYDRVE
ncbi:reverse transcriptase [Gossypium australe]|uniref:Reverse transcriptase n=1 Tax=Gossypium australe TaxID=47621 RepID=A0A5B6WFS3_9ROSI|nr:reverse transcriptase [Gossypium australe]